MRQGLVIFRRHGLYSRTVLRWQLADFALQLATLYLMLLAFGVAAATLLSVLLIRTAQRVTVSLPGFLETGSQGAMIVAILSQSGFAAGQAFGFGFGSKATLSGLNVVMALIAARGDGRPVAPAARIGQKLHRSKESAGASGRSPRFALLSTDPGDFRTSSQGDPVGCPP